MRTRKYYQINYTKANGGDGSFVVKARNEGEAIANAKDNCFTGSNFVVMGEVPKTSETIKGGGSHRQNK